MSNPGTTRPRVLVAIPPESRHRLFGAEAWARLHAIADVATNPSEGDLDSDAATAALADAEVVLTGWGTNAADTTWIDRAPRLHALVHSAGSVRPLVDESFFVRGVRVSSQAEQNGRPVAEYALAMILLGAKGVLRIEREFRGSRSPYPLDQITGGNFGARVGIVAASKIGRRVLEMLRDFEVVPSLYDPYVDESEAAALGARKVELDELFASSDVVSVHAPLLSSTARMITAEHLSRMPDGAVIINTARGGLLDQEALIAELSTGRIDAVLDVTDPETLPEDSPLWDLPNVFLTPHLAGSVGNEVRRLGDEAVEEVRRIAEGAPLRYPLTLQQFAITA